MITHSDFLTSENGFCLEQVCCPTRGNTPAKEYVFIFDAINEISDMEQVVLLDKIKKVLKVHGVRVVLTYRNHAMGDSILSQYKEIAKSGYEFPGVSFESAIEWLRKTPVIDISEYMDVLYSNNPLLLSKLQFILQKGQSEDTSKNNVSRYTYIYEQSARSKMARKRGASLLSELQVRLL